VGRSRERQRTVSARTRRSTAESAALGEHVRDGLLPKKQHGFFAFPRSAGFRVRINAGYAARKLRFAF
jgi:hypothetical protein